MNKTALITGASRGIGEEIARIHASKGDDLVLVARTLCNMEDLKSELEKAHNIRVYIIQKDLSVRDSAKAVYDEVTEKGIVVDYLVNNAGFGDFRMFAQTDWDKQEKMISVNITALTHLTRLFIPGMIGRGEGRILNVASVAAFQPGPRMSVYFASKAFVLSFSQALNNEMKGHGITVTALCPGSTSSNFEAVILDNPDLADNRKKDSAREVAEYGYKAMMKGKAVAIYGAKNRVMLYLSRFFPREFIVKMARQIQERKHL